MHQVNNTALGQVIVLPNPGSAQYNSVIQKVMSCHICFGKPFGGSEATRPSCTTNPYSARVSDNRRGHY